MPFPLNTVFLTASAHGSGNVPLMDWLLSTNVFNILLMALLLGFLIQRFGLLKGFAAQHDRVVQEIQAAEARRREAQEALAEVERRTGTIQQDIEAILAQAQRAADTLSAQLLSEAQADAQKIVDAARARVAVEQQTAAAMLEARLLKEALADARHQLAHLPEDEHQRAIEAFIEALPYAHSSTAQEVRGR